MVDRSRLSVAPLARWSSRIALFSASLFVGGLVLHRLTSFPTPVALNLFMVAFAGCAVAMLAALIAFVQIWRKGYAGAGSATAGVLVPLLVFAGPLLYVPAYLELPQINDVSTDFASPPRFSALGAQRAHVGGANAAVYPGEAFAHLQQTAYPDLRTFVVDRSVDEAFELVEEAVRRLRWRVVAAEPPAPRTGKAGTLEATDQTLLIGFTDDIVIRVEGSTTRSRVDVRSASRYGRHDFGQNASRVRRFLAELQTRVDSTSPAVAGQRGLRTTRASALVKRLKERDPQKAESRSARDRAQSGAQRVRAPRETQR